MDSKIDRKIDGKMVKRPYQCNSCNDSFMSHRGLMSHKSIEHSNIKRKLQFEFNTHSKKKLIYDGDGDGDGSIKKIGCKVFTPVIVSGIMIPTLPKFFRPIQNDSESDLELSEIELKLVLEIQKLKQYKKKLHSEIDEYKHILKYNHCNEHNLHLLADVICNMGRL